MGKKNKDSTAGVLSVFDFVQSRKYYGLQIPIPSLIETLASWWTFQKYHTDKYDPNGYIQGRKTGLHLNFIPKYRIQVKRDVDGGTIIQLDYWARIRKTGIVAAFVTYGVTAAVGAGTLSYHCMEAKSFLQAFWQWFDGSYKVVKVEVLVNEERTAMENEEKDKNGNVSKTTTTTNNYYNTYGNQQQQQPLQQQHPPQQYYQQPMPVGGSSGGYSSSGSTTKSSGTVYPVATIHSPATTIYPTAPPTPSQIPIPPPTVIAGAAYAANHKVVSPGVVGYQTTITSHTTAAYPVGGVVGSQYGSGTGGSGYSFNSQQLQQQQHSTDAIGARGGYGSTMGSSGGYQAQQGGQYGNVAGGGYANVHNQSNSASTYGTTGNMSGYQQQNASSNNNYSGISMNSGGYNSQQQQQQSTYGNNNYSGTSMNSGNMSGYQQNTSGYNSQQQSAYGQVHPTQQETSFVQSLYGSVPPSSTTSKPLPPPSTAILETNKNDATGSSNLGYNSSLPPYPTTASTEKLSPPSVSAPQMVSGNSGSNTAGSGTNYSGNSGNTNAANNTAYGTHPVNTSNHKPADYSSLRHGGLGFGYTYEHLADDLKKKSENLNKTHSGNAAN